MAAAAELQRRNIRTAFDRLRQLTLRLFLPLALSFSLISSAQATKRQLLETEESKYNSIFVYKNGNLVEMTFGLNNRALMESIYNSTDERELPVPYTRFVTASVAYLDKVKEILEIGSGAAE